ncbi:DUF2953 domain-containing protein [Bacillus solitudinis]|uniref:DUF2953 domain-containing protein n=1 Tax=Bacillus solitudinis TaxID=2014074 RepID=UPI000C248267|nr:DUF2953 domain-containing protein [Bacillus solitudinis]
MNWFIVAGLLLLLFILFLITKVSIDVQYEHKQDDDLLEVVVYFWKLRVYTFSAPLIRLDFNSESIVVDEEQNISGNREKGRKIITKDLIIHDLQKLNEFIQHVAGLHKIVRRFLGRISVHFLKWKSEFGIGDAAHTGQLIGTVWTIKGSIIGLIGNYMKMKRLPEVAVTPHFQEVVSRTKFTCMLSFRIGHAIVAGLMIIKHWKKRPKLFQPKPVEKTSNV